MDFKWSEEDLKEFEEIINGKPVIIPDKYICKKECVHWVKTKLTESQRKGNYKREIDYLKELFPEEWTVDVF